jgi:U4/U6 small nuclear ribonucleoprotein PRP4
LINQTSTPFASGSSLSLTGVTEIAKQIQKEVFYSPAVNDLILVRKDLSEFSFKKAQERLTNLKRTLSNAELELENDKYVSSLYSTYKEMTLNSSQFGDERPLSSVRYAPSGTIAATGSLASNIKLWDVSDLGCVDTLRGHQERITSVSWHPTAYTSLGILLIPLFN